MLIAKRLPSIGSVPEPSSSKRIRLFLVAILVISTIFKIWEEKVLKDSLILCSSPISAKILSKTYILLFYLQGIKIPLYAINNNKPVVFKQTVLPPVFGPVIISEE